VLETPRPGRTLHSALFVALPTAPAPATAAGTSPATVADPAVAAFIADMLGAAHDPAWEWRLTNGGALHTVMLADVGLAPIDTVVLSAEDLRRVVAAQAPVGASFVATTGSETHEQARRLLRIFGSQPATAADLTDGPADPVAERAELAARYQRLRDVGALLHAQLSAAATVADREVALRNALRWGITPTLAVDDDADLSVRTARARDSLGTRLQQAPADVAALTVQDQARAIAELAAPEGQLAVLARVDLTGHGPFTAEPQDAVTGLNDLDGTWLGVAAAVREPASRLDLHQLETALDPNRTPLRAWTNRPGDPWLVSSPPLLHAIYGPDGVVPAGGGPVALGLLDRWAEVVPATEQHTAAVFGFNAPAARAPQAILLAVPPDVNAALDTATLVRIVAETRELAHARMVTPLDVAGYSAALPSVMLPASGSTAVSLEATR
jgi:hypothetical protein